MADGRQDNSIQASLDILNLINTALPGVLKIINMIKDADPGMTMGDFQKQAADTFASNIAEIEQWHKDHSGA
jgi:hypothetical protein